jgi:GPH family glycoside/pentoside/hexuronide:cation symporter
MSGFRLFLYGAGQLGIMLLARFFFQWLIRFADVGKDTPTGPLLAATLVGGLFFAFRIFDGITDPLAGVLGDRWVRSGKERRSLIWVSFAIPPVGLALVFAPTSAMPDSLRYVLVVLGMFLFFVGYTLYAIPYWSLVEDYSQGNTKTRTALSNALGVGVLVATGLGFVLSPMLVESMGFFQGAIVFATVGTVLMTLPYFAAPPGATTQKLPPQPSMFKSLAASLTHKRFLAVILLFAGAQMSLTVMTAAAPYIAEKILGGKLSDVALLLGPFLLSSVPTFAIVPALSRRFGWEKATLAGVVALSVAYTGAGMLGQGLIGSPMTTAMIVFACAGPGCAFVLGLEGEAIARCAQSSEHKSTGIYFGIYNFIVKALNGLALFLTGLLADQGTVWAVRAMPIIAGALCIAGVLAYVCMKKSDPVLLSVTDRSSQIL